MIQYIENTNLAYCDGYRFRKDKKTGYWLCSTLHKRLHVYIYEKYNGMIPKGYQIHHIDHNKDNNEISNLKLVSREEHNKIHREEMTEERRQQLRDNFNKNARPKAIEWHKTQEAKEWHRKHYEEMKDKLHQKKKYKCLICGKEYESKMETSKFCSNACKSKNRRMQQKDLIEKKCIICNKTFKTNKFRPAKTCNNECKKILKKGQ